MAAADLDKESRMEDLMFDLNALFGAQTIRYGTERSALALMQRQTGQTGSQWFSIQAAQEPRPEKCDYCGADKRSKRCCHSEKW